MLRASTYRKATIALADYDSVIGATHPAAVTDEDFEDEEVPVQEKTAVLRENRRNAYMDLEAIFKMHGQVKTAQEYKRNTSHVSLFRKRRELEEAKMQKAACEIHVKDAIDYLASEFSKYNGPDFSKFAAEALALHGNKAKPVIASMSVYLRCKTDMDKVAEYTILS